MPAEFIQNPFEYKFTMTTPRFQPEQMAEIQARFASTVDALLRQRWYRSSASISPHGDTLTVDYRVTAYTRDQKSVEDAVTDLHETASARSIPEYSFPCEDL